MAAKQLIIPGNRAFSSNGLPESGAVLKFYVTGTLTPLSVYTDAALTVSAGASVTANGAGRFDTLYADETVPYRLRVLDKNGAELDDIDPIYFGASTDAANSASAAATSATNAANSASAASTSATNAASSATAASGSATSASSSDASASASAAAASTSATAASTSASNAATSASNAAATASAVSITTPPAGASYAIVDDFAGNAASYVDANGIVYPAAITPTVLAGVNISEWKRRANLISPPLNILADIIGVPWYGQSKSLGHEASVGTYSFAIPGSHLMFNANGVLKAGPRAQEGAGTQAQNHGSLIPFTEQFNSTSNNGETGQGQFARAIDLLLQTENGITTAQAGFQFLFSAPGQSNTKISGLAQGTVPYNNLLADVQYGVSLALAAGKTYNCPVVFWAQGEADISGGTTRSAYSTALQTLYTNLNTDIKALTGQSNDIKIILYNVEEFDQTNANIALAQQDAAAANPSIVISHPDYCIPHISTTDAHYPEDGYAHTGSYWALAFKRLILDSGSWTPLKQSGAIQRTGNILSVPFSVPVAPLIADAAFFPLQTNYGFDALDHTGAANAITNVTILYNRVRITLTTADSGTLRYCAGTTYGGNLRDSQTLDLQAFRRRQLSNCCLPFEKAFT